MSVETSLRDSDGYKIDFENRTDVPEETKLSEWNAKKLREFLH